MPFINMFGSSMKCKDVNGKGSRWDMGHLTQQGRFGMGQVLWLFVWKEKWR